MVEGVQQADLVFFVGYHCRVGSAHGVGNETVLGREMIEIRMNGVPVGESEINASVCAYYGVPVGMVSGDDLYCNEARHVLGDVETAITKYAIGRWTARCLAPERSWANIRQAAKRAVERGGDFKPYQISGPITYEIEWTSTAEAYMAALMPGVEQKNPRTVVVRGDDALTAWKGCFAALLLGWSASDVVYG
jgi:D-amino peptidase